MHILRCVCSLMLLLRGASIMKPEDQERFRRLYAENLRALRLHGKRSKTIDSYSRTLRRVANFFDQCPDDLSVDD